MAEHIGDEAEILLLTHRAERLGFGANVRRRTDQLRMSITHFIAAETPDSNLIDQHPACQSMVDNATSFGRTS